MNAPCTLALATASIVAAWVPSRAYGAPAPARSGPEVVEVPWTDTPEPAVAPTVATAAAPAAVTVVPEVVAVPPPQSAPAAPEGFARPRGEAERMAERPLAPGITLKPGKGLSFGTADKRFSLTLNLAAQFLYTASDTQPTPMGQSRTTHTFEIRRARAIFSGNVFTEHIKYYLQVQFSPRDLGLGAGQIRQSPVFMAWTAFDRFRDFTPQIGFFFINYSRQRVQPILKLQFPDFSLASSEFGLERDIGIDLGSKDLGGLGKLRYHLGVFMGEGTDFARPLDFGMTYVGRVEVLPMGDFDDYFDVDFARRRTPKLSVGAGYAYADNDARNRPIADPARNLGVAPSDGGTTDSHNLTADLMFKVAGLTLLGDVWLRYGQRNYGNATVTDDMGTTMPAAREAPRNGIGWTGQGGFLLPRVAVELGGRYSAVRRLGIESSIHELNEVGPALGYYFAEHSAKLQLDYAHGWGEDGVDTERVRLQLTLSF